MTRAALLICAALASAGCAQEACTDPDLAALELRRHGEIALECVGYMNTPDAGAPTDCPALPAINAKYRTLREKWVACQ